MKSFESLGIMVARDGSQSKYTFPSVEFGWKLDRQFKSIRTTTNHERRFSGANTVCRRDDQPESLARLRPGRGIGR